MTQTLTVPTHFEDISELARGLADRADKGQLMLYGPAPYPKGASIRFTVLLFDQTPALEGTGTAIASIDGGDDRQPEVRFDIVLDGLRLEGSAEVVYERILMARDAGTEGERPTGAVRVDDVVRDDEAAAHAELLPDSVPPPAAAAEASSNGTPWHPGVLSRATRPPAWKPGVAQSATRTASTGLFQYTGGVPLPAAPPRPDLDASLRVAHASRPDPSQNPPSDRPRARKRSDDDAGATTTSVDAATMQAAGVHNADTHAVDVTSSERPSESPRRRRRKK